MSIVLALIAGLQMIATPEPVVEAEQPSEWRCLDGLRKNRCSPQQQALVRARFGMGTIEAHRDAGDEARRAFFVDLVGNDQVALTFVRPRDRNPELIVHFQHIEGLPDLEPLRAPVPPDIWDTVIARSRYFDRELVPIPEPRDSDNSCVLSPSFTVEATSPPRWDGDRLALRSRTARGNCEAGLTSQYALELAGFALNLLPYCALLRDGSPTERLSRCGLLSGDRLAAAEVSNAAAALMDVVEADDSSMIENLFESTEAFEWNGERPPGRSSQERARFWVAKVLLGSGSSFFYDSIEGERAGRVRMRGGFIRWASIPGEPEEVREVARFEMIWRRIGRDFVIQSVVVGPFTRLPRR